MGGLDRHRRPARRRRSLLDDVQSGRPFGKRGWRLVGFSLLLTAIGQGLYTDYYDYRHARFGTLWPREVLDSNPGATVGDQSR